MHESGVKLLNMMFREWEEICVSPNKYGYHSVPLPSVYEEKVTLKSPNKDYADQEFSTDEIKLVALNPINGFREDKNCTAFRSFLIEMDSGSIPAQLDYVKRMAMPYSAAIYSGSKSVHFLITLSKDLPDEESWRKVAEWILGVLTMADPLCKNPSRSIRVPGAKRDDKRQLLLEFNGPVDGEVLGAWLDRYPDAAPREREKTEMNSLKEFPKMKPWMAKALTDGIDKSKGRNQQWFAIACEFALHGFSEDETQELLSVYFMPDRDFKTREWKGIIKSAFKYVYEKK